MKRTAEEIQQRSRNARVCVGASKDPGLENSFFQGVVCALEWIQGGMYPGWLDDEYVKFIKDNPAIE